LYRTHIPDDGIPLAAAIVAAKAVLVTDASLKDLFGTASMVLEGATPHARAKAVNITPGPIKDGDSYRCELAGIIGGVLLVIFICETHAVTSGKVLVACDNISTLRIFAPGFIPEPTEESFDLVCCLHQLIKASPITFTPEHVHGHQADKKAKSALTRLEALNDEMDNMAKAFWNHLFSNGHNMIAPQLHVAHEGWTLWHRGTKLSNAHTNVLYPILEDHRTIEYWTSDHHLQPQPRIQPSAITNVDWLACKDFMKDLHLYDRRCIPKHASENCGVGITLQHWGKQSHNRCPRCDQPENVSHTLLCQAEDANTPWRANFAELEEYLAESETHPSIQYAILHRITQFRFRDPSLPPPLLTTAVCEAVCSHQDQIGWQNFLQGLPAKQWKLIQHRHYKQHKSQCSATKWMTGLLKKAHFLALGQWKHRNDVVYNPDLRQQQIAIAELRRQVTEEYARGPADLPPRDRSYFRPPLLTLLDKHHSYLQSWLVNLTSARSRQARRSHQGLDPMASSQARGAIERWCLTRKLDLHQPLPNPT